MKKYIVLSLLSLLICGTSINFANAKTAVTPALSSAIKLYKAGNYAQCYTSLQQVIKNEPANALAYYYLAMSAVQVGKKEEAINNYEKVISLSPSDKLTKYAEKGKVCIESPSNCHDAETEISEIDEFIQQKFGSGFSEKARSEYERLKIENMMREMDRKNDIPANRFKEYKDFSSYNDTPTNEEIVMAFRIIQKAGLSDFVAGTKNISDLSWFAQSQTNDRDNMISILTDKKNSSLSPQLLQTLISNQMNAGF